MASIALFNLPKLSVSARDHGAAFDLPILTLSAEGAYTLNSAAFPLPIITLSASGITGKAAVATFSLPILTLAVAGYQNGLGNAALSLPMLRGEFAGVTGHTGAARFDLPVLELSIAGLQSGFGTSAFSLPILYFSATGQTTLVAAFRTWVLNLRKGALTEYDNFAFNSYARFNGQYLACGAGGVVVLGTQALDGTTAIAAIARTGMNDFDFSGHKRVPRLYLDGEQTGDLHFKAITVEGGSRTYLLPWNNVSGHTQRRVPIGKGPRSRFWQFEINNVAGSDFSTSSIMAYPSKLRRRVA